MYLMWDSETQTMAVSGSRPREHWMSSRQRRLLELGSGARCGVDPNSDTSADKGTLGCHHIQRAVIRKKSSLSRRSQKQVKEGQMRRTLEFSGDVTSSTKYCGVTQTPLMIRHSASSTEESRMPSRKARYISRKQHSLALLFTLQAIESMDSGTSLQSN